MDTVEQFRLIDTWIKYQYEKDDSAWKEKLLWAEHKLWQLTQDEPILAWQLILDILKADQSSVILQNLAAGPLEDLLSAHGELLIDRIEQEAKRNSKFAHLLGGVWQGDMPEPIWQRVHSAASSHW